MRLTGKVALVTGAQQGIGKAIALAYGREGASVVINYVDGRAAALELASHKIRVNAIAPGLTDTAQPRYGMSEEELQAAGRQVPLGRIGTPEDVAELAVFLASEESRHITGQTIHVNGGQYLS